MAHVAKTEGIIQKKRREMTMDTTNTPYFSEYDNETFLMSTPKWHAIRAACRQQASGIS